MATSGEAIDKYVVKMTFPNDDFLCNEWQKLRQNGNISFLVIENNGC